MHSCSHKQCQWLGNDLNSWILPLYTRVTLGVLALQDRQMRLWDLRTNVCQGLLQAPARPCAAFDQQVLFPDSLSGHAAVSY